MLGRPWMLACAVLALPSTQGVVVAQGQGTVASAARETLEVPAIFADGLVLQRGKPIPVWGWAKPWLAGDRFSFTAGTSQAVSDAGGAWRAVLPPEPPAGRSICQSSSGQERVERHDVLVGDVWLASGQSNMEFRLAQSRDAAARDRERRTTRGFANSRSPTRGR